jgi:hypothetical protein
LADDPNSTDAYINYRATSSGTFTVMVTSYYAGDSGSYRLNLAQVPTAFIIPPDDEGGPLSRGGSREGSVPLGDIDFWTINANAGDNIALRCARLTGVGPQEFHPSIRLYAPNGALLAEDQGSTEAVINHVANSGGTFTILVTSYYSGDSGTYRIVLE